MTLVSGLPPTSPPSPPGLADAGGCPPDSGHLSKQEQTALKNYRPTFRLLSQPDRVRALLAHINAPGGPLLAPLPAEVAGAPQAAGVGRGK